MNININTIDGFIKVITDLQNQYADKCSYSLFSNMVYRGLADNTYSLIPSLFRYIPNNKLPSNECYQSSSNNTNDYVLKNSFDYSKNENLIINDFSREALRYLPKYSNADNFSIVELAQHYGAPTRLLDWTTNPLVALYFACKEVDNKDGSVWMLNKNKYAEFTNGEQYNKFSVNEVFDFIMNNKNNYKIKFPLLLMPHYFDERMAAQSSVFMMWGNDTASLDNMLSKDNFMFYNPESKNNYTQAKQNLNKTRFAFKVIIPAKSKMKLLDQLCMLGISESSIFPGLDSVGKTLKNKYTFMYSAVNIKES